MIAPPSAVALNTAIRRLILDAEARTAFLADPRTLGADARTTELLLGIDREDLSRLSRAVLRGVASGSLCGISLESSFPGTFTVLGMDPEQAIAQFLASPEFGRVSVVGNSPGYPAARAFYDWVLAHSDEERARAIAQREYVRTVMVVLSTTADPLFEDVDRVIRRLPDGWIALLDEHHPLDDLSLRPEHPIALGVGRGRLWGGRLPLEVCATLLLFSSDPPAWAAAAVSESRALTIATMLRSRGML
jgi:hypothetical protein